MIIFILNEAVIQKHTVRRKRNDEERKEKKKEKQKRKKKTTENGLPVASSLYIALMSCCTLLYMYMLHKAEWYNFCRFSGVT